ncbi:hypothetical protein chiPu_0033409, partial [Chiloscyllium punctatum]|nr:hypothetical protein [Chiloscyllium punctatum]
MYPTSSRRRPGPITTNSGCLALPERRSRSQHWLRRMGPGLRRDDEWREQLPPQPLRRTLLRECLRALDV